jgi:bifunctional non-homologous end joining protein LigD
MLASRPFRQFFIKLHRASSLHYDFRLEHGGVLKSWVLADGLCLDPTVFRSAVSVADHEVKSGGLEKVFPPGHYGAGPTMLWDYGIWIPCQDVGEALQDGHLVFHLLGSKVRGIWSLRRRPVRSGVRGKDWLLKKERDAEAWPLSERNVVAEMPKSVLSGRTLEEVAADPGHVASLKKSRVHRNQRVLPF